MASVEQLRERHKKLRPAALEVKEKLRELYGSDPNFIGSGWGVRFHHGEWIEDLAVVVYVNRKLPPESLRPSALLPQSMNVGLDRIPIDVFETGPIYPQAFIGHERPARIGVSVGHKDVTSGTLGAIMRDAGGALFILSNNHVLANENNAFTGDRIDQPGPDDQLDKTGATDYSIGGLNYFFPLDFSGGDNHVDCATCRVHAGGGHVVNDCARGEMSAPTSWQPAVGLLFAGSGTITYHNPMPSVISTIGMGFVNGSAYRWPNLLEPIQKTGRTTEYTTGQVNQTDAEALIAYGAKTARFVGQIASNPMSAPGDSGSVTCAGGSGEAPVPYIPSPVGGGGRCASLRLAQEKTGVPLTEDEYAMHFVRDRYLRTTLVGRWAVELFYRNEERLQERGRTVELSDGERAFAQSLYAKYSGEARLLAFHPEPDLDALHLTAEHVADTEAAFKAGRPYLRPDEQAAASRLFEILRGFEGKTGRELLALLDDQALLSDLKKIAASMQFLDTSEPQAGD